MLHAACYNIINIHDNNEVVSTCSYELAEELRKSAQLVSS